MHPFTSARLGRHRCNYWRDMIGTIADFFGRPTGIMERRPTIFLTIAGALIFWCFAAGAGESVSITNLAGLRTVMPGEKKSCDVRMEALVCSISKSGRELVLADGSGAEVVRLATAPGVRPGQKILLAGAGCELRPESWGVSIMPPSLIENDGLHGPVEKTATIYLPAGRVPVRLEWFNASQGRALNVAWQPPGQLREKIPAPVVFRRDESGGWTNGLDYRGFEGSWQVLPDFENLAPVTSGAEG